MRTSLALASLVFLPVMLLNCGDDDDSGTSAAAGNAGASGKSGAAGASGTGANAGAAGTTAGSGGSGGSSTATSFTCPAGFAFQPGKNTKISLSDYDRDFYIEFPTNTAKKPAIVFQWHGFGDTADNFHSALGLNPDADPDFPFILVTPDDTSQIPPDGLDWQMFAVSNSDKENNDMLLFSAISGCLIEKNNADQDRVYSVGFSAGAIETNMVHAVFAKDIAATVAYSGAWFNDKAETDAVDPLNYHITYDWPALDPAVPGTVLITHGGTNDVYKQLGTTVINFETSAASALPFLAAANYTVVDCHHNQGHAPAPDVNATVVTQFLKAHTRGQASPWKGGSLPAGMPASCTLH